jgi:hypothetical protein
MSRVSWRHPDPRADGATASISMLGPDVSLSVVRWSELAVTPSRSAEDVAGSYRPTGERHVV